MWAVGEKGLGKCQSKSVFFALGQGLGFKSDKVHDALKTRDFSPPPPPSLAPAAGPLHELLKLLMQVEKDTH